MDKEFEQKLLVKIYRMLQDLEKRQEYLEESIDLLVRIQTELLKNKK